MPDESRQSFTSSLVPRPCYLVVALGVGYVVADYWRMRRVAAAANLPYHPTFAADPHGLFAADGYRLWTAYLLPRVLAALADRPA